MAKIAWGFGLSVTNPVKGRGAPFRLPADVRYLVNGCLKGIETVECLDLLADADDHFEFLDRHPQFFEDL